MISFIVSLSNYLIFVALSLNRNTVESGNNIATVEESDDQKKDVVIDTPRSIEEEMAAWGKMAAAKNRIKIANKTALRLYVRPKGFSSWASLTPSREAFLVKGMEVEICPKMRSSGNWKKLMEDLEVGRSFFR
jgi:hypothetical protein